MPWTDPSAIPYLVMAAPVLIAAVGLGYHQWVERARRFPVLSEADARHFSRQDRRRFLGSILMVVIAVLIVSAEGLPPDAGRQAKINWAMTWLGVGVLLAILVVMAMLDLLSIRVYAGRHRRLLASERRAVIAEEIRRGVFVKNGQDRSHDPLDQSPLH